MEIKQTFQPRCNRLVFPAILRAIIQTPLRFFDTIAWLQKCSDAKVSDDAQQKLLLLLLFARKVNLLSALARSLLFCIFQELTERKRAFHQKMTGGARHRTVDSPNLDLLGMERTEAPRRQRHYACDRVRRLLLWPGYVRFRRARNA